MGVEIPAKYGGSDMSFTSALLVVEEIARVSNNDKGLSKPAS